MHCVAKQLRLNRMQQQARHITGVEVGGIVAMCLLTFFVHTRIEIGNSFDPDFTLDRTRSMKDCYAELAKIGGTSCSEAYKKNNLSGCYTFCCRYNNVHSPRDVALALEIKGHELYLKELDVKQDGRVTHLLLLKEDILKLGVIEKEAGRALSEAELSWAAGNQVDTIDQEECQRVLSLTRHIHQCKLYELNIIEKDMPNYVHEKQQEKEKEMSNLMKKSKSTVLISRQDGNKE